MGVQEVSPRLFAAVAEYIKISKEQEAQQSAILQAMGGKPSTPLQIAENSYNPHNLAAALVFMRKKFASIHPEGAALADDILSCVYLAGGAGPEFQCAWQENWNEAPLSRPEALIARNSPGRTVNHFRPIPIDQGHS